MRFRRVQIDQVLFKEWLCEDFRSARFPLPENIRQGRNTAIKLMYLEMFCCILSFGFYARRRSRLILAICIMNIIFTFIGIRAKLTLSYCGLIAHSMYGISVLGGFYIYIMIDSFLTADDTGPAQDDQDGAALSRTTSLLLSSFPMLGLFFMACYSCHFLLMVDDELDRRENYQQNAEAPESAIRRVVQVAPRVQPEPQAPARV